MIENINKMLETNDVMVLIDSTWYRLEEIHTDSADSMPIIVSDDDGEDYELLFTCVSKPPVDFATPIGFVQRRNQSEPKVITTTGEDISNLGWSHG